MYSADLQQGRTYCFTVLKDQSTRKFFKIKINDELDYSIPKFKFQYNLPLPDSLCCYVKSLVPLSIGQDIAVFIKDFYEVGKEYDFLIKDVKNDTETIYELQDYHDLCFKLYNAPESLSKGSKIKCKILKINGINVTLKYVGTLATKLPLDFLDFSQWLTLLGYTRNHDRILRLLEAFPQFETALNKYDNDDPVWIFEVLQAVSLYITDWLIQCKDDRTTLSRTLRRMKLAKKLALLILEESDYLRNCSPEQRTMLQSRLSNYVEHFTQYGQAAELILNKKYMDFIDGMFHRLKEAGYLYKPRTQFRIMMTILKLRPEMINSRMGELFDALHNWDVSNWQSEPFRSALVQQLQIFIEGNSQQINTLPAHDSGEDNKTIVKMILAIAVQSILATDSDLIDLKINRAMLYRYISYLNGDNVNILLDKAAEALLGIERQCEFTWSDTEHPTLLILKSSHPLPNSAYDESLVKTYTTSQAIVRLRSNSLQILAKDGDPETTVISNNLIDWLNPVISLDPDTKIQNIRKSKDLATYDKMWADIRWAIFGHQESPTEKIEKTKPYGGEEVKVIIDNVRVLHTGNERQRLQFHCTIYDDLYVGEGWMPCDSYHMIGWMSYKDIPGNYDGSLSFAHDEDGSPLLFDATVIKKNDELEFSMKSQIEDFLLESLWQGCESMAIVTHFDRLNNSWLCLSDLGCTFKVPCDDTTTDLVEGKIVKVRYIEPDRSGTMIQFFIGELAEEPDEVNAGFRKEDCLTNLMRAMGSRCNETLEENSAVVEVEEVMSREELLELIYLIQRRAQSESEYLKAFNYLGLASVLSKIAEAPTLFNELMTHMELLRLLQDFGRNQKINREWLETCREKVNSIPKLERIYTRLQIVADLDANENADWLWEISNNPRNETEEKLASLVLSYNMLPRNMENARKDILKEISTLLNVNSTAPTSKYYGDESQTVEFKSSLIYSTRGGSRPNIKDQLYEIAHTICGFMNARGGNLYIGVNDSGYENGLDDDIAYRISHGHKGTIDSMMVDLQNYLDRTMPPHAKDHWEIMSDPDSKKGVIIVKVAPVQLPVELDGVIYVRSSSTTKHRTDKEREEFIKSRSHNYQLLMKLWGIGQEDKNIPEEVKESEKEVNHNVPKINPKPEPPITNDHDQEITVKRIKTGRHRLNVLHSYEQNYATPSLYAYFMEGCRLRVTPDDAYIDYEPDCLLALAVKPREKGWLVFAYDNGEIIKFPLDILTEFAPNETKEFKRDVPLECVNIAGENDYLLTILRASYGALFYRLDSLHNLATSSDLTEKGKTLCDNNHTILTQEIVTADKVIFFDSDAIDKERRFFGVPLPVGDGTLTEEERINNLLRPLQVTE